MLDAFQSIYIMSSTDPRTPALATILSRAAEELGATLCLEPDWRHTGQITFASGKRAYFRGSSIDINPHGASEVAKDKAYAAFFMRNMGFPVVHGEVFYSDEWCALIGSDRNVIAAEATALALGFPMIVKPNSASQGRGVWAVGGIPELRLALRECFTLDRVAILQPLLPGRDYRVVVLGDEIISAYERIPLNVCGDGQRSIAELLREKADAVRQARGWSATVPIDDPRIEAKLRRSGLAWNIVPEANEIIYLLDNANLSSGGDAVDYTGCVAPDIGKLCVDVSVAMGLKLCGVDLIVQGNIEESGNFVQILEVNSSPGLDNYAAIGTMQQNIVHELYRKVLCYIENN